MTDLPAQPGKKGFIWIIVIVLILFIFGTFSIPFTEDSDFFAPSHQSAGGDLDVLVFSFYSLLTGDIEGFISYLVLGLPVLAIFMILFGLLHFLLTLVFKDMFNKRIATVLAVILALYGLIDSRIYRWMINLNTFTIAFLVFSVLVIFLWGFTRQSVAGVKQSHKGMKPYRDDYRMAKKYANEQRRIMKERLRE